MIKIFNPNEIPYGRLSNNYYFPIFFKGERWNTVSHYVYSELLCDSQYKIIIKNQRKPKDVYRLYQQLSKECENNTIRDAIFEFIEERIKIYPDFEKALLETGNTPIVYNSTNKFLGIGIDGKGLNMIGRIYEKIRYKTQIKYKKERDIELKQREQDEIYNTYKIVSYLARKMSVDDDNLRKMQGFPYSSLLEQANMGTEYMPKFLVLEQYEKGILSGGNVIREYLNNHSMNIVYLFRKYNLADFRRQLLEKQKQVVFNHYVRMIFDEHFSDVYDKFKAIHQELSRLNREELTERVYHLYENEMFTITDPKTIQTLDHIRDNIPSENEINDLYTIPQQPTQQEKTTKSERRQAPKSALEEFIDSLPEPTDAHTEEIPEQDDIPLPRVNIIRISKVGSIFSPMTFSPLFIKNLYFPTLSHYIQTKLFHNLLRPMGKTSLKEAHFYIMIDSTKEIVFQGDLMDETTRKQLLLEARQNYVNIDTFEEERQRISNILLCDSKKKLFEDIAVIKFQNDDMQRLLVSTGSDTILYDDKYDNCLGIGENYTGKWLMTLRENVDTKLQKQVEEEQDIILLSISLQNDKNLLEWIFKKLDDICFVATQLLHLLKSKKLSGELITFISHTLFKPCEQMYIHNKHREPPTQFRDRIIKHFDKGIKIQDNAVSNIWKYISLLIFSLMKSIKRSGLTPYKTLSKLQNTLTTDSNDCVIPTLEKRSRKERCIVSSIINIIGSLQKLRTDLVIDEHAIIIIGSILIGNEYKPTSDKKRTIFDKISHPLINADNHKLLDNLFSYLVDNSTNKLELSEKEKVRVMNRINFFADSKIIATKDISVILEDKDHEFLDVISEHDENEDLEEELGAAFDDVYEKGSDYGSEVGSKEGGDDGSEEGGDDYDFVIDDE